MSKRLLPRQSYKNFVLWTTKSLKSSSVGANTVWQLVEKAFRLCSALVSGILIARYLQPEQYGVYNYAIAFVSFFVTVSHLSANQIFVRELVKRPEHSQEIVSSALFLRILSGILSVFLAIVASFIFVSESETRLLIIILSFQMIFRSSEVIECFFQSRSEYKHITLPKSISSVICTLFIVTSVAREGSIFILATACSAEFLMSFVALIAVYIRRKQILSVFSISLSWIKSTFADSWPLIFSGIAITIYVRIDQIMINNIVGSSELGLYSVAVQMTEVFYIIPVVFIKSNFPKIVQLREENEAKFYSSLQSLYSQVSFMSYVSIISVSIFSEQILTALYGPIYSEATSILTLLVWSVLFVTLGTAQSTFIIATNLTGIYLKIVLVASAINIFLNYLLIPIHGAFGAAIATVFSYWIAAHGACFIFSPLRKTGSMITKSLFLFGMI